MGGERYGGWEKIDDLYPEFDGAGLPTTLGPIRHPDDYQFEETLRFLRRRDAEQQSSLQPAASEDVN